MINLAGTGNDEQAKKELEEAGLKATMQFEGYEKTNECKLRVTGSLDSWRFTRSWYYWVAKGPGINIEQAVQLNEKYGTVVRADGYAGGIQDLWDHFKGFAVGTYHIDTQEGLNAFAALLKKIMKNAETKVRTCPGNAN